MCWRADAAALARGVAEADPFADGDVILVKGSRSMRMETFLETLNAIGLIGGL